MIPLRLQLKNFMSYGEGVPPLDFTGVRIACLSGDNGNGKTALLDAMTWALYGETRATSDDDVIRLGAADCQVIFDFDIGGVEYRVHKARGRRGGAVWELQVRQDDGATRSLSGVSARETKARIEQLLRMDYRTFLASGYLAQGRADEFARASVNDRKKVLADILDLSRYERLEQLAKDRRKDAEDRETDADRGIRAIDSELATEDRHHLALEAAQSRLVEAEARAEIERAKHNAMLAEVQMLEEREARIRELEGRIPEIEQEIATNTRTATELERRIADARTIVRRREDIEAAHTQFLSAHQKLGPLESQYDSVVRLQREQAELDRVIRAESEALERDRYRLDRDVRALAEEEAGLARHAAEIDQLLTTISGLSDLESRAADIEQRRAMAEEIHSELKTKLGEVRAEAAAVEKRLTALMGSAASLCEYCGQPLSPERRQSAIAETDALQADCGQRQQEITRRGREARTALDTVRADADRLQADLGQRTQLTLRLATAQRDHDRIVERTRDLPDARNRLGQIAGRIARREYAPAEQQRLAIITAELAAVEKVGIELANVRDALKRLATADRDRVLLKAAEDVVASEPARVAEIHAAIERRQMQIAVARKQIEDQLRAVAGLPELRRAREAAAVALRRSEDEGRAADREIGQFTALLARCTDLKRERSRRAEERLAAARERELYRELIAAFGRKGVQALIIENALPEIEEQANDLLGRMTDGGLQLRLVTQREAKTRSSAGASIETLDIILADEMGTRPYEMYSGGEAFRINFALRIALSRLLAQRAGAPLQTLILDEGFGTQDPRGREAIVDAIHGVADSFALILVITHIDELKEAFPTRIEVTKGPGGSSFTVV